jgi:hypothetical protein
MFFAFFSFTKPWINWILVLLIFIVRWYGRKIFHVLMSHDEFDKIMNKHVGESTRKNIKEILDTVRVKGPGEAPTDSARNSRKNLRNNIESSGRSGPGSSSSKTSGIGSVSTEQSSMYSSDSNDLSAFSSAASSANKHNNHVSVAPRLDMQSQESIKLLCSQLRNPDFRERMDALEKFQVICETETELAIANLVSVIT